jgi:adenylyltransferase/sulfurtransferase
MMRPDFATDELQRYSRHLTLPDVGLEGQRRLRDAKVLLVGAGGLGSPVALYLAAAGVGRLGIVDHDRVDLTNLQRQVLHGTSTIGQRKTVSAQQRLRDLNPHVDVAPYAEQLTSANALEIFDGWDIVVDGSDNFPTRYLVNDACVLTGIPNVYGSVHRFEGQASVFAGGGQPCYRCLFRDPPPPGLVPSCAEAGVFGVLPGLIGMIQATETIKFLLGIGESLVGRLLLVDAQRMHFRTVALRADPECPACGTRVLTELIDYEAFCGMTSQEPAKALETEIAPAELSRRVSTGDAPFMLDVREPFEHRIARIEGAELVPMAALRAALSRLPRDREMVVYCHHGQRSAAAAEFLRSQGFARVRNLTGGIDRWSVDVDATVPRY